MATDRKLRNALLERLGVTPQALHKRTKKIIEQHGPMSTEDATYVVAHIAGLNLTKYLDKEAVDRVRGLVPRGPNASHSPAAKVQRKVNRPIAARVKVTGKFPDFDAPLSRAVADDARKMAEVYPKYYVLENSIRTVIQRILRKRHGADWWDTSVSKEVKDKVNGRVASEDMKPWHGKRGQHPIFYSDFADLRKIIERNWPEFEDLFPNRAWITSRLDDLEHPRNVLAHHNPISARDHQRLDVYFDDWKSLIEQKRDLIP